MITPYLRRGLATGLLAGLLAGLLWNFRLASLGTQLTLWTVLGASFGALCERANRKDLG